MAEPKTENINVPVSKDLKGKIAGACVLKPDGVSRYSMAEVMRIMLARGFAANHHIRLEEAADGDAGEEGAS